jgi:predicted MPP superfamily phosphohydrolase
MKTKSIHIKKSWIILLGIIAFGIFCFLYAHFEYGNIKIKNITLESSKLKGDGLRIMFISDFQFDTKERLNKKALQHVIDTVNLQEADVLFIGGDFVNFRRYQDDFYDIFKNLRIPKLGAYAILGNHDYYSLDHNIEQLESLGITMLINDSERIFTGEDYIQVAGVEDLWFGEPDFETAMNLVDEELFTFFMTHNPDYFVDELHQSERQKLDFVLSGHTHAGQVSIFGLWGIAPISKKNLSRYRYGLHYLDDVPIYISSGTGGNALGFFIRFFARPEIVLITLRQAQRP